jgi:predicted permease
MTLIKHAFRQLVLRAGLSALVIVMLAVGVGAATAIFSLFYQVLVQPLPVPAPERLVNVVRAGTGPESGRGFSYPMFRDLEAEQSALTGLAADFPFTANVVFGDRALAVEAAFVSGSYFGVLGLQPALGRMIGPQDEPRAGESPVAVLSYDFWRSRFGADPTVVGRTLAVDGHSLTVIGVAPAPFTGTQLGVGTQLFVPITMRWGLTPPSGFDTPDNRNFTWLRPFARLRPGVTAPQAAAALNVVYSRILREREAPLHALSEDELRQFLSQRLDLTRGARGQGSIPGAAQSLTLLLGVTLFVLLIVCVNVANLLLVRGAARAGEMAIRESIGASRGRLLAELLIETALPAAIGGVLALPVAAATLAAVTPILPTRLADGLDMALGPAAVAFTVVATVASVLVFGFLPALRTARTNPALAIKGQATQTVGGRGARRLRGALVTAQIAFSMVLLALAGLFAQSLHNVARIDLGMNIDSLVSFGVSPRSNGYDAEGALALDDQIRQALAAQPGVVSVASAAFPLIASGDLELNVRVEGFDNGGDPVTGSANVVGPGFFRTLGIPLLAGREFTAADRAGAPRVAIVNEQFARRYGLDGDAIGKHLQLGPDPEDEFDIIGVVGDAVYSRVKGEAPPQFFMTRDNPSSFLVGSSVFYVRTAIDSGAVLRAIPRVIAGIDPALPVDNLTTMRRQAQENVFVDRLVSMLSASFAGLATLLAAIGLYGVMAYSVATRTRELGLRLALGAEPGDLRAMVLKQVGWMALIGLGVGLAAAIGFGRAAEALLYGLSGHDPLVLVVATAVLAAVVLGASYWPARRASSIAPMEALRYE